MKKHPHINNILNAVLFLALTVLVLWGLTKLTQPKYYFNSKFKTPEAEMWSGFYALPKNSVDVLFLGSSCAYCGFDAPTIAEETGKGVFTMASSSAETYDIYYMLQEALRFQSPSTVVLEMDTITFEVFSYDVVYKRTYDNMRWSSVKLEALKERNKHLYKPEALLNRFVPLIDYHSRWKELTAIDFAPEHFRSVELGFVPCDIVGEDLSHNLFEQTGEVVIDETSIEYLDKIVSLCREKGIKLVLMRVPLITWNRSWSEAVRSLAEERGLPYIDYNEPENYMRVGIVDTKDWRDAYHLNKYGARKFVPVLLEDMKKYFQ